MPSITSPKTIPTLESTHEQAFGVKPLARAAIQFEQDRRGLRGKSLEAYRKEKVHKEQQRDQAAHFFDTFPSSFALYMDTFMQCFQYGMGLVYNTKELKPLKEKLEAFERYCSDQPKELGPISDDWLSNTMLFDQATETGESLGTILHAVFERFPLDTLFMRAFTHLSSSRMGVYEHLGVEDDKVILRELMTGETVKALLPGGSPGQSGELWYVRILPPMEGIFTEHVVFTVPYVIRDATRQQWFDYFDAVLPLDDREKAYKKYMKFGPSPMYWATWIRHSCECTEIDQHMLGVPNGWDIKAA